MTWFFLQRTSNPHYEDALIFHMRYSVEYVHFITSLIFYLLYKQYFKILLYGRIYIYGGWTILKIIYDFSLICSMCCSVCSVCCPTNNICYRNFKKVCLMCDIYHNFFFKICVQNSKKVMCLLRFEYI
jgi:hypothetical protein